jgi:hypothetical protein
MLAFSIEHALGPRQGAMAGERRGTCLRACGTVLRHGIVAWAA